jgi:hypothetical protein
MNDRLFAMRTENESDDNRKSPGLSNLEQRVDLHGDCVFKYPCEGSCE